MQPLVAGPVVTTNLPFTSLPVIDDAPQLHEGSCVRPRPGWAPATTNTKSTSSATRIQTTQAQRCSTSYGYCF
jgi:hypothetical protein